MEKLDLAKENYQQAIAINSNLVEAHINLGNLSSQQQEWQAAIESYDRAIDLLYSVTYISKQELKVSLSIN
ncbi:MAG: tetratricopeptide repeat protein [Okeania sp. SIO3C4]|nr:tetratricopeptide repeat protein [Okeania sp. SIO3B3]NER07337.1 tetratricopeptide repeat protein [Okeania sp. SIO3C4]